MKTIESDYARLRNNISFVPYYEALIDRIAYKWQQANANKDQNTTSVEMQKLKFLYTLVKSRLFGIKTQKNYVTVADLSGFLNSIKDNILDLKTIENRDHIEKYRNDFMDKLNNKIKAADDMIQNTMLPFIDKKINDTENDVKSLKEELKEEKVAADKALKDAKENERILKKKAFFNAIMGGLQLAATGLSMLGPQCAIVGAGLSAASHIGTAIVGATLTTVDVNVPKKLNRDRVMKVAKNAKTQFQDIQQQFTELKEIQNIVGNDFKPQNAAKMKEMTELLAKIKSFEDDKEESKLPSKDEIEWMKTMFEGLNEVFSDLKKNDIVKKHPNAKKSMVALRNTMAMGTAIVGFAQDRLDDAAKIDEAHTVTQQVQEQIELIKLQEMNILQVMLPQMAMMVESVHDIAKTKDQDHVQLILARWSIQNTLADVKSSFNEISANFKANDDLNICIQKITEAITTVIEVHNQIDSYRDTQQLANLIADISNTPNQIHSTDPKWFDDMKTQIKKNLVIEQYEMAMSAVKHHMFPFVGEFLLESDKIYRNVTDEKDLIAKVALKIDQMLDQINNDKALVTRNKNHVAGPYNFEKDEAFYRWNQNGFNSEMHSLFNGSKVTFYADINRGLALSGIKFNKIWIRFVLSDSNKEREFNEKLDQLKVRFEMEMEGNTYYRCDNRIYYMPLDEPIQFFLTLNNTNPKEIRDPGGAYETLQQNAFFLSPYTTWKISLEAKNLESLKLFSDDVSAILLEGTGKHLEKKDTSFIHEICSDSLDEFYSLNTINAI